MSVFGRGIESSLDGELGDKVIPCFVGLFEGGGEYEYCHSKCVTKHNFKLQHHLVPIPDIFFKSYF